jgi:hypothetical protein
MAGVNLMNSFLVHGINASPPVTYSRTGLSRGSVFFVASCYLQSIDSTNPMSSGDPHLTSLERPAPSRPPRPLVLVLQPLGKLLIYHLCCPYGPC